MKPETWWMGDDVFYSPPKTFERDTKVLRLRLEQKRGRKHVWFKPHEIKDAFAYARRALPKMFDRHHVRVSYQHAQQVLHLCDQRYHNEVTAAVAASLSHAL